METPTRILIEAIERERNELKLSDRKFSKVLGISPAYWCLLKSGDRRLTPNLAVLFMQKLPELTDAVSTFIMRYGNDGENHKTVSKNGGGKPLGLVGTRKEVKQPQKT